MQISLDPYRVQFQPWRPEHGRVFNTIYSFDSETTCIDEQNSHLTPSFVLGAAFDGRGGYFLQREYVADFFATHKDLAVVMHNAPFDLAVLDLLAPSLAILDWVEHDKIWDTQLLHRLLMLGTEGHTASGRGLSTLEHCTQRYVNIDLPKDLTDSSGNNVRLSYSKWLRMPPNQIETIYLEYLAKDVIATLSVYEAELRQLQQLLTTSASVWGYVSPEWLSRQADRWGWQTHHIQLKAAIALKAIASNGLHVDVERRNELSKDLTALANELRDRLRDHGYLPGANSNKALQEILRRLERVHPKVVFSRTATGKYVTSRQALEDLSEVDSFVRDLLDWRAVEKLQSTFLSKMGRTTLRPSFDVLRVTGRTSSFGEINAQNLPRDDRLRSCFKASPGHVYLNVDYAVLELATLAQSVIGQFGLNSEMANAINARKDLHRLVASQVTGKPEAEVTDDERQKAKAINFGKPGGMGESGLKRYAKASYGVDMTDAEVQKLSESWFELFPEMRAFLSSGQEFGRDAARIFDLTPLTFLDHTGSRKYVDHPSNRGQESAPHPILGAMCLKSLSEATPSTRAGADYPQSELDYFWSQVQARVDQLPGEYRGAILARESSIELQRAVRRAIDKSPCMTLTGRVRANASYCARHNTLFQGLAADGAKLALWRLLREDYRIVNFIHDEVLIEIREDSDLGGHAERVRQIMINAMREVVPDVRIDVKFSVTTRWYKNAKATWDDQGHLALWDRELETQGVA